jgi:hypothetical protein
VVKSAPGAVALKYRYVIISVFNCITYIAAFIAVAK